MSDDFLKIKLLRVIRRYQWLAFWRKLAATWAGAALLGVIVVWLERELGWSSPHVMPWFAAVTVAFAVGMMLWHFQTAPDFRWVARRIEKAHPELNGVLLTAVQQGLMPGVAPGFLQYRVIQEATARSQEQDWRQVFPTKRFVAMQAVHLFALACFVYVLGGMRGNFVTGHAGQEGNWVSADGMSVSPGDTSIEKGDSLVVLARFQKSLPPTVSMVVRENGAAARSVPLVKSLADPVFGGSVPEVATDLTYHLEYRGQRTRDFKVTVFEHPKLVRADVDLTFPGYTKLPVKHIEDTRRVSAVEGTKLDYALQLNKPVKSAKLVARDAKKTAIPLQTDPAKAVATLPAFVPAASGTYDLQLVDADGRANKVASTFVIDVQPNRPPELRINAPRGDQRPSALEEMTFDGTVWDDFGVSAYGLAYSLPGQETKFIELGRDAGAKEKKTFNTVLKLEQLGVKPDDLISWYVWADDVGPDGKVRRTQGDLYFAEVRPFDEIFRESQDMQQQDSQGQQMGQGNQRRRLTEMQKQVINATWRLQRDGAKPKYADDAKVVLDSQAQVKAQAEEAAGEARNPREQALWKDATDQMDKALDKLKAASSAPGPLAQAMPSEQAAYQALLKLQARETNVTRSRNARGGGGGGGGSQRQIDQLDLKQAENRYETQRQAQAPKNQERLEQLAVMNRLQELARRQQDLNDRLKELQTALQEAKTDAEREEARKRLKRLEEEQRQMLADADEIRQRMDRTENQSSMSDQRQQLDQTREDIQKAADAAEQGSVAQALAAGTRAQRQLQQMRDDMRKENSSQFADDLREMRAEARDLSNKQEEIGQKLDALSNGTQRKSLSDSGDRKELLDQLGEQKDRMEKLVDRAQQVSEQAENTEPLLSKSLYDSVRKVSQQDDTSVKQAKQELANSGMMTNNLAERLQQAQDGDGNAKAIDLTRDILREGFLPQASQANQRARAGVDELKRGVERAAESVLGDDAEQLKLAQSELDQLTDALQREMNQAQQGQSGAPQPGQRGDQRAAQNGQQGGQRQPGQPGPQPGDRPGEQPGLAQNQPGNQRGQQAGQRQAQGQGQGQGQQPQPGDAQSQAQANADGQQQPPGAQQQAGGQQAGGQRGGGGLADARNNQPGNRRGRLSVDDVLNNRDGGGGGGGDGGALRDGAWNGGDWGRGGVLTGDAFNRWQERLRDVETLLDAPDLRNRVAMAIERANILRREYRNDAKKPDWAVVQLQVLKPLVEVRERVAEDLARRDSKDSLAPIDRDPVPARYAESVRKYYEELGKDKPTEAVR